MDGAVGTVLVDAPVAVDVQETLLNRRRATLNALGWKTEEASYVSSQLVFAKGGKVSIAVERLPVERTI